jgi:tripartite ATP-independent transporter DctP family solute receptor
VPANKEGSEMRIGRRGLAAFLGLVVLLAVSAGSAVAGERIRVATVALSETYIHQGLVKWKNLLDERAKGHVAVTILDRGVMGGDREMIEAARLGTLEAAVVSGSVLANLIPQYYMVAMPYLFKNHDEANAFLDGPIGQKLFALLEAKDLVGLGWGTWSFRGIWNNARPITGPEDLKGLKIRTVETKLDMSIMNSMGGVATPMSWNECLLGLRQGTVDGISTTYGLGYHLKLYELAKFASRTQHYYESAPLIMSKKIFARLSPEAQRLVKETATEAMLWARKDQAKLDEDSKALIEAKGPKVNALSPEAFAVFQERTKGVYDSFRNEIGSAFMDEALVFLKTIRR